jgi:hypothetical protein
MPATIFLVHLACSREGLLRFDLDNAKETIRHYRRASGSPTP